jgi:hypothetical protein
MTVKEEWMSRSRMSGGNAMSSIFGTTSIDVNSRAMSPSSVWMLMVSCSREGIFGFHRQELACSPSHRSPGARPPSQAHLSGNRSSNGDSRPITWKLSTLRGIRGYILAHLPDAFVYMRNIALVRKTLREGPEGPLELGG